MEKYPLEVLLCVAGEGEGGGEGVKVVVEEASHCWKIEVVVAEEKNIMKAGKIMRTFVICFQYTLDVVLTESGGRNCPTLPDEMFEINHCRKITLMSCVFI